MFREVIDQRRENEMYVWQGLSVRICRRAMGREEDGEIRREGCGEFLH
jgi:hypothetical protein